MKLTYDEAVANYEDYYKAKAKDSKYSLELATSLKSPSALRSAEMLDSDTTFYQKMNFVQELLDGNVVSVLYDNQVICSFNVHKDMALQNVPEFIEHPYSLRFLVSAIYGEFLKNSRPHLANS